MKTEFNVERVCDRVHLCVVDSPDDLGQPVIEVRNGSIHVSFPEAWIAAASKAAWESANKGPPFNPDTAVLGDGFKPKKRGK